MSELSVRLFDVFGRPLDDTTDVLVSSPASGRLVARATDARASAAIRISGLTANEVYLVRARPVRHRQVGQFVRAPASGRRTVEMTCPVDPTRVTGITPPPYASLPAKARAILAASTLEHPPRNVSGEALYTSAELSDVPRAGLLNILAKMARTPLPDNSTVLDHVDSLYRVRGDRVFANVATALRDLVKTGVAAQLFREVDGSLHRPDPAFRLVDSFKTPEPHGNLQVTFFASLQPPLRYTADIDIDDAGGIAHVFQVIEHTVTDEDTNPYDIHQILIAQQMLDPGYRLLLA
jgi:hypothetical protein